MYGFDEYFDTVGSSYRPKNNRTSTTASLKSPGSAKISKSKRQVRSTKTERRVHGNNPLNGGLQQKLVEKSTSNTLHSSAPVHEDIDTCISNFSRWMQLRENYLNQIDQFIDLSTDDVVSEFNRRKFLLLLVALRKSTHRVADTYESTVSLFGRISHKPTEQALQSMTQYISGIATRLDHLHVYPFLLWIGVTPILNPFFMDVQIDGTSALLDTGIGGSNKYHGLAPELSLTKEEHGIYRRQNELIWKAYRTITLPPEDTTETQSNRDREQQADADADANADSDCVSSEKSSPSGLAHHHHKPTQEEDQQSLSFVSAARSPDSRRKSVLKAAGYTLRISGRGKFGAGVMRHVAAVFPDGVLTCYSSDDEADGRGFKGTSSTAMLQKERNRICDEVVAVLLNGSKRRRVFEYWKDAIHYKNVTYDMVWSRKDKVKRKAFEALQLHYWRCQGFREIQHRVNRVLLSSFFKGWEDHVHWCRRFHRVYTRSTIRIKRKYLQRMRVFAKNVFDTRIYRRNITRIYMRATFDYLKFNAAANRFALKYRFKKDSSMSFNYQTMRKECFDRWKRRTDCVLKLLAVDDIAQVSYIRIAWNRWKNLAVPHLITKFKAAKGIRFQDPNAEELLKYFGGEHAPERLHQMKQRLSDQAKHVYHDVADRLVTAASTGGKITAEALGIGLRESSSVSPTRQRRLRHNAVPVAPVETDLMRKRRMQGAMKKIVLSGNTEPHVIVNHTMQPPQQQQQRQPVSDDNNNERGGVKAAATSMVGSSEGIEANPSILTSAAPTIPVVDAAAYKI